MLENHSNMSTSDLVLWTGVEFLIAGYTTHHIQKEKREKENEG